MTVTQNENKIQGFQTLNIQHVFSSPNVHPFDEIKWERQTAEITDDRGKVIFKQENVEVPSTWSPLAVKIAVSKYFYGEQNTKERETSIKQLIHRVCRTISDWGLEDGYFTQEEAEIFYKELCWLCVNQCGAFNSPVWFNIGIGQQYGIRQLDDKLVYCLNKETNQITKGDPYSHGQASACFIISVKDSIEDIWKAVADSAKLFKYGSGVGADWSSLRSTKETLTGGGKPSGPVSFMRVQDSTGGTIKSGGKTRRSAIMQTLRCWHPDILEFVNAKSNEEKKVWALIEQGYDPSFNGEAYGSVSFQNVNQSVRATDDFMKAATEGKDYDLLSAKDRKPIGKLNAAEVLRKIAEGTHICGDPGLQFEDTIQHWHTLPNTGPINSSNPCCVTGDTLIAVADGRLAVPIKELVGTEVPVYTHDHSRNKTTVRLMWNIGVKRKNVPIYKITLDDGSSFKATDDHPVMIRSGAYQLVKDLKPGTSVMPFHLKVNKLGKNSSKRYCYWTGEKWIPQYIAVWKYFNGQRPVGFHVHHKDFNPLNDLISNFELLTQEAHLEVHRKSMLGDNNPARRLMNDEWRKNLSKSSSGERNGNFGRTYSPEVRLKMKSKARLRWSNPEEHEKHKIRVNKWIAEKRERGEPVGPIKRKPWLTLCCPVCRNTFVTDSDIRIYCSKKCAGKEVGKKVASALKGRPIPQEIKDKLRLKGKARGLSRASELAKIAHKNSILKFARFLFDKGIIPTFESWDLCRKQYLPESGLKKVPMVTTLTQRFESEDDLKEQAQLFNHKVVSVEFYGNEDVYDGTVEETHNFAIFTSSKQSDLSEKHLDYSGLFIHNSEYMSIDDSPCNLASLNLMKFTKTSGEFDVERFKSAVKVFITAQDILVSNAGYPNEAIARNAIDFRQLGLGYSNLGALLMSSGLAYDSDEARNLAGSITALMHLEAYNHSSRLAASIGAFSGFEVNRQPMLKVMKQHLDAALSVNR
jgi:ribonucleotide reductase alpha subunit